MNPAPTTYCPVATSYLAGSASECNACPNQLQVIDFEGESHLLCRLGEE